MSKQKHTYIAQRAPFLKTRIVVNGKDVKLHFQKGRLELDDAAAEVFDAVLAENEQLAVIVKKVDYAAALELAHKDFAERQAAQKGGATTANVTEARVKAMHASSRTVGDMAPNNPEELQRFQEELGQDFPMTETVKQKTEITL